MASLTTSPERLGAALGQLSHAKANFLKSKFPQLHTKRVDRAATSPSFESPIIKINDTSPTDLSRETRLLHHSAKFRKIPQNSAKR